MPKCDFNKVALQLYWNRTSASMFSRKFAAYFQNIFSQEHFWRAASVWLLVMLLLDGSIGSSSKFVNRESLLFFCKQYDWCSKLDKTSKMRFFAGNTGILVVWISYFHHIYEVLRCFFEYTRLDLSISASQRHFQRSVKQLNIFAKNSILDIWLVSEWASSSYFSYCSSHCS